MQTANAKDGGGFTLTLYYEIQLFLGSKILLTLAYSARALYIAIIEKEG